jgi:benzoyl-CoA oxygenase/reductase BoxA protein
LNAPDLLRQHLIDPEICIRCNTCEETCPKDAITHDSRNYVVDPATCEACLACIAPCPTGAIDNWRLVPRAAAFGTDTQLGWDVLPPDVPVGDADIASGVGSAAPPLGGPSASPAGSTPEAQAVRAAATDATPDSAAARAVFDRSPGATVPPWSASHPYVNLYTQRAPVVATVTGNVRVTDSDTASDTHHIVLDFGATPFPVLEGQSIGILPPGVDADGRPHFARQYSVASPRDGERPGYNNVAITVKRVAVDHDGRPVRGVCSHYLCDLAKGDSVQVIGPFGNTFLMPNHPGAHLLMICTGTGSAPMRAMTERRRRRRAQDADGRLMLFFGARTERELPYFGPLMSLPKDFIDINLAYSRTPGAPRRYVQDAMRERAADVAALVTDPRTFVYVCGLKGMEAGVLDALRDVVAAHGHDWPSLWSRLKSEGRLHFETY